MKIALIWQRFLPYHVARIEHLEDRLSTIGHRLTAIEVSSQDDSYGFPTKEGLGKNPARIRCFSEKNYHDLSGDAVFRRVLDTLSEINPDVVFAPAVPFPEGMAAFRYRNRFRKKAIMMDDAWEHSDTRGAFVRSIKRIMHQNIDGVFIPALSHKSYYEKLGFPSDRIIFGVDVVDNRYFGWNREEDRTGGSGDKNVRASEGGHRRPYFLFVGRFLPRKGIEALIVAYRLYCERMRSGAWDLVLVGGGELRPKVCAGPKGQNSGSQKRGMFSPLEPPPEQPYLSNECMVDGNIHFVGPQFGEDLRRWYLQAGALIVPSEIDPWGLVVNEGMAAGLPVIVSRGCGAAKTLVHEGENGWTFEPGDGGVLARLMHRISLLSPETVVRMGETSKVIIASWDLDRFADGVLAALDLSRRPSSPISRVSLLFWKGHIRIN